MSRKHNVKKERTTGGYKRRLAKRGLAAAPRMRWSHCDGAMSQADIAKALAAESRRKPSDYGMAEVDG